MGRSQSFTEVLNELKSIKGDFKSTVIAAELVDNGISSENIFFKNVSTFRRFISKDVASFDSIKNENDEDYQILLEINREGLYDMLPLGVVHSSSFNKPEKTPSEIFALRRQEEREARSFFSPFENEFLHRYMQLEIIEREISNNKNRQRNREIYEQLYGDSGCLSDVNVLQLIHVLPLAEKIRNNVNLISSVLSKIFGYTIIVTSVKYFKKVNASGIIQPLLGSSILGVNTIVSDSYSVISSKFQINIVDIEPKSYLSFVNSGENSNVLHILMGYFFSANSEIEIILSVTKKDKKIQISDNEEFCFLGFNSYI